MQDVRDCGGHLVCRLEAKSGFIVSAYKRQKTMTTLPVGGSITIEREGIRTTITRLSESSFDVYSHRVAA